LIGCVAGNGCPVAEPDGSSEQRRKEGYLEREKLLPIRYDLFSTFLTLPSGYFTVPRRQLASLIRENGGNVEPKFLEKCTLLK
jgi:hypothetical protein